MQADAALYQQKHLFTLPTLRLAAALGQLEHISLSQPTLTLLAVKTGCHFRLTAVQSPRSVVRIIDELADRVRGAPNRGVGTVLSNFLDRSYCGDVIAMILGIAIRANHMDEPLREHNILPIIAVIFDRHSSLFQTKFSLIELKPLAHCTK